MNKSLININSISIIQKSSYQYQYQYCHFCLSIFPYQSIVHLCYATQNIPPESHNFTSVFILATAGMRLLTEEKQENIYRTLKEEIRKNYNFELRDNDVGTITGQEEAEYNWVAINYALGNLYMQGNPPNNTK